MVKILGGCYIIAQNTKEVIDAIEESFDGWIGMEEVDVKWDWRGPGIYCLVSDYDQDKDRVVVYVVHEPRERIIQQIQGLLSLL